MVSNTRSAALKLVRLPMGQLAAKVKSSYVTRYTHTAKLFDVVRGWVCRVCESPHSLDPKIMAELALF